MENMNEQMEREVQRPTQSGVMGPEGPRSLGTPRENY